MNEIASLLLLVVVVGTAIVPSKSFQSTSFFSSQTKQKVNWYSTRLFSTTSSKISLEKTAERQIGQFQEWAGACGVQAENGFCFADQIIDGNEDYFGGTSTGVEQGYRVLYVPGEMILSAYLFGQQIESSIEPCLQVLREMDVEDLTPQFYLFLQILIEYEKGDDSPYKPWLNAMPRKWNTAVSMDDFCLSCLPPYLKSLCEKERDQLRAFHQALKTCYYVDDEVKNNAELLTFAYNVVFTRSSKTDDGDIKIIPVADMINHGDTENVYFSFDEDGSCNIVANDNIEPGSAFTMSYGPSTNPSKLLATYGFLNEAPAAFCKMIFNNPSDELVDMGCDPDRMLISTVDGSIAEEVWDVLLYSRLERKSEWDSFRKSLYEAHMTGDEMTKAKIHASFRKDITGALLRHVNHIRSEVFELTVKMDAYDTSKHPRIPLLKKHHEMVMRTFSKVRQNLLNNYEA